MKTELPRSTRPLFILVFSTALLSASANEARLFRIVGPTATAITAITPDGLVTWTNAQIGANYIVQTARSLGAATNWIDYVQVPASNSVVTHRLYDLNPPAGMVFIPAGSFTMGNCMGDAADYDELPLHTVYVSAFYMDRCLVTSNLWSTVYSWSTANGYSYTNGGIGKAGDHPYNTINWYDAVKWCNARSQMEGSTPCYYTDTGLTGVFKDGEVDPLVNWAANGYRLPTEAEWEKAARGGASGHRFPWADAETIDHSRANYDAAFPPQAYDLSYPEGYHPAFAVGSSSVHEPGRVFCAQRIWAV